MAEDNNKAEDLTNLHKKYEGPWSVESHMELLMDDTNTDDVFTGNPLEVPSWFDIDKFRRGQKFFKDNYYALFVSKLCGLVSILCDPSISKILVMTNQSSEPKTAFKRYLSTIAHMLLWYNGDVHDKSSWAYKSLREVHLKHSVASRRSCKESKKGISQSSLALTQFGFMGFGLLRPEKLGILINDEQELEGFIHFWRTIGYMVGIQDRYNICRDSVQETKDLCQKILDDLFTPVIKEPFKEFTDLSTALLQGMWAVVPEVDVEGFSTYMNYLIGLPVEKCSNWFSQAMFKLQIFVHETLLGSQMFGNMWRAYLNFNLWLALTLTMKFPFLAYYAFGVPLRPFCIRT